MGLPALLHYPLRQGSGLPQPLLGKLDHSISHVAGQERKALQVALVRQKGMEQPFREVDDVAVYLIFKIPAVHLPGGHEVHLPRNYRIPPEVDGMEAAALREEDQVVERMPVCPVEVRMHLQIRAEALGDDIGMP